VKRITTLGVIIFALLRVGDANAQQAREAATPDTRRGELGVPVQEYRLPLALAYGIPTVMMGVSTSGVVKDEAAVGGLLAGYGLAIVAPTLIHSFNRHGSAVGRSIPLTIASTLLGGLLGGCIEVAVHEPNNCDFCMPIAGAVYGGIAGVAIWGTIDVIAYAETPPRRQKPPRQFSMMPSISPVSRHGGNSSPGLALGVTGTF
jgi:hypothetical protein